MCDKSLLPSTGLGIEVCLTAETVQGTALALQSVDDIERRDSLALGVLSVGDGVTDNTLQEGLENTAGLLVDHYERWLATVLYCF